MPAVPFKAALSNAPRKLTLGVGLFFLLKITFFVVYGGSGGGGGPIALLLALIAFTTRRPSWAIALGVTLLLNAFGLALVSSSLGVESGAGLLVAMTAAVAATAAWGSFGFARSLKKAGLKQPPEATAGDA